MKQEVIGIYYFGFEQVELVVREGTGGEFWVTPEPGKLPRIKIGIDEEEWSSVITVLLHEAYEFILDRLRTRYELSDDMARSHAGYVFMMTHETFAEACARVADFIAKALPDLTIAYEMWKLEYKED